jgi:hypothetical protein
MGDKNFEDLWGMITWNHALQGRYSNLLILVELAHVQCVLQRHVSMLLVCKN